MEYLPVTVDKSHLITIGELMKDTKNPRQAFSRQSKLLRDAFVEGP